MRKNFGSKSWLFPMPVFIVAAYDENGKPNCMNAAWGGMYTDNTVGVCIDISHKTTKDILKSKAFTISMATVNYVAACDYVGIVSGNNEPDKFAKAGFSATISEFVNAPVIKELPMTIECELLSYDEESCFMTGKIANISADESVLDDNGEIDYNKLQPVTYDPVKRNYVALGEVVGKAFCDGKKLKS